MHPYTLPLPKFLIYSGLGETKARQLITAEEINTAIVGGRRMIVIPSYHAYVERQMALRQQDARRNKAGAIPAMGTKRAPRTEANAGTK
jgi:hypothetical protein